MSSRSIIFLCVTITSIVSMAASNVIAGLTFLGPTPYLSAADSPFVAHFSSPNFYLEDFEDGELNTLGLFQPLHPATHAVIQSPSSTTNSVDADDGFIDGFGSSGFALESSFFTFQPTDPPVTTSYIRLAFEDDLLLSLPNRAGFVITQQPVGTRITVEAFDKQFASLGAMEYLHLDSFNHSVLDDVFVGLESDSSDISVLEIRATYKGNASRIVLDHVQYGVVVPEPNFMIYFGTSTLCLVFPRRRYHTSTYNLAT